MHKDLREKIVQAVEDNDLDLVAKLLNEGASGDDAMRATGEHGNISIFNYLVERGVSVNAGGFGPLYTVSMNNHIEMVKQIIEVGGYDEYSFETAIRKACERRHTEVAKLLIEKEGFKEGSMNSAMYEACVSGDLALVEYLESHGADIHHDNDNLLAVACNYDRAEIVDYFLMRGLDVNQNEGRPIINACEKGNFDVIKLLINHDCNIHFTDDAAFKFAAANNSPEIVNVLFHLEPDYFLNLCSSDPELSDNHSLLALANNYQLKHASGDNADIPRRTVKLI